MHVGQAAPGAEEGEEGGAEGAVRVCFNLLGRPEDPAPAALAAWEPDVHTQSGAWVLHAPDLHLIAVGAGILGAGGGGSPGRAKLKALIELQRWEAVQGPATPSALPCAHPPLTTHPPGLGRAACVW